MDGSTKPESHWVSTDPEAQPPRDEVLSVAQIVEDTRLRLGPEATPAAVLADIRARGLEVSLADVRSGWIDAPPHP